MLFEKIEKRTGFVHFKNGQGTSKQTLIFLIFRVNYMCRYVIVFELPVFKIFGDLKPVLVLIFAVSRNQDHMEEN